MAKKRKKKGMNANLGMLGLLGLTLGPQLWQNRQAIGEGMMGAGGQGMDWLKGLFGGGGGKLPADAGEGAFIDEFGDLGTMETAPQPVAPPNYDDMSFNEAFRTNRNLGADEFNWRGNPYTTELAQPEAAVPSNDDWWVSDSLENLSNNRYADLDNVIDDFKDASHYGSKDKSSWQNFKHDWGRSMDSLYDAFGWD